MYFHVVMRLKGSPDRPMIITDLTEPQLTSLFIPKFNDREPFAWGNGRTVYPGDVSGAEIWRTPETIGALMANRAAQQFDFAFTPPTPVDVIRSGTNVTHEFDLHIGRVVRNSVFIVHGRNQYVRAQVSIFLHAMKVDTIEWVQAVRAVGKPTPSIAEILEVAFAQAQAIVVLMTPDDEARLHEAYREGEEKQTERELIGQPRQNVLFEAGMAWRQNRLRTVIVEMGAVRPMSDISGLLILKLNNSPEARKAFADRLEVADCEVDLTGNDWLTAGDLSVNPVH